MPPRGFLARLWPHRAPPPPSSLAARARALVTALVDGHAQAGGQGADAYDPATSRVHPMAEGKYLSALAQLHAAGLLSDTALATGRDAAVRRLSGTALDLPAGFGWGLNFAWADRGMAATDPYLVTSAVVVRGLAAARDDTLLAVAQTGLQWWITERRAPFGESTLPVYALRRLTGPVVNAAALAIGVSARLGDQSAGAAGADLIHAAYAPGAGWIYAPGNPTIDLLHQAYIVDGLLAAAPADADPAPVADAARAVLGQFRARGTYADKATLLAEGGTPSGLGSLRQTPAGPLHVQDAPARLWSLGEALLMVTRLAAGQPDDPLWPRYGTEMAQLLLGSHDDGTDPAWHWPRHRMHVAHGLAAWLAHRRNRPVIW